MSILQKVQPAVFGFLILIAFIEMVITAVLVASYNRNDNYPSSGIQGSIRFLLFASLWTILFCGAYIAAFLAAATSVFASIASHLAFLFLTLLFWTGGAGAITNYLDGGLDCGDFNGPHCNNLNASMAFAWIQFIFFFVLFFGTAFLGFRSRKNGNGITGPLSA